jgi:hypothetical protein
VHNRCSTGLFGVVDAHGGMHVAHTSLRLAP